jgi:hypothetical protein
VFLGEALNIILRLCGEVSELHQIDLCEDDNEGFGLEEGLDALEKSDLLFNRVATGF